MVRLQMCKIKPFFATFPPIFTDELYSNDEFPPTFPPDFIFLVSLKFVNTWQVLQKGQGGRGLWASEAGAGAVQSGARPGGAAQPGQQEARAGDQAQEHGPQLLQVSSQYNHQKLFEKQWRMYFRELVPPRFLGLQTTKHVWPGLIIGRRDKFSQNLITYWQFIEGPWLRVCLRRSERLVQSGGGHQVPAWRGKTQGGPQVCHHMSSRVIICHHVSDNPHKWLCRLAIRDNETVHLYYGTLPDVMDNKLLCVTHLEWDHLQKMSCLQISISILLLAIYFLLPN